ncbi:hypothetical protein Kisp01_66850 [Kineosporia sp. NBRC 101677]|uniref:DUF6924 domain-containing protein n=1 Tax=Kineosporia sp. NBRC 101677 TaxID=3032197 RepID=UPI0024A31F58|nr:hypothetical protein [Kineosporia sp. NBRC 101677]GLY19671.1 hypothetical protein Kisp01_66850 [Kineosporia sp. NBRC 101677]
MPTLPMTEDHLVIRTDFSDPSAWAAVQADLAQKWGEEFEIYVEIIDDPAYDGLGPEKFLTMAPADYPHTIVVLADSVTMTTPDRLLLVVSLEESDEEWEASLRRLGQWDEETAAGGRGWENEWPQRGGVFRSTAPGIGAITANLSVANMDLWEYAAAVDGQGVFRNFENK